MAVVNENPSRGLSFKVLISLINRERQIDFKCRNDGWTKLNLCGTRIERFSDEFPLMGLSHRTVPNSGVIIFNLLHKEYRSIAALARDLRHDSRI